MIPSLRTITPDPLNPDLWPERTVAKTSDVVVCGVSLVRLAEICETPCTHSAPAAVPGSLGRRSAAGAATTITVRITGIKHHPSGRLLLEIDADLSAVPAVLSEMRLIGRISVKRDLDAFLIVPATARQRSAPFVRLPSGLPADLGVGDLLAVPCSGTVTLHDIRP